MSLIEGEKVKIKKWPHEGKVGKISLSLYSAGMKGIGRGWKYFIRIPDDQFSFIECKDYELEDLNEWSP